MRQLSENNPKSINHQSALPYGQNKVVYSQENKYNNNIGQQNGRKEPMREVGNVRVSTTEQADHDLGIPDQIHQIKDYCEKHQYTLIKIYEEAGASASDDKRPVPQEMMAAIENGLIDINGIVVLKTSRFFRNIYKNLEYKMRLRAVGVDVISMDGASGIADDENPIAEAFEIIAVTFDHLESRNIGYHTSRGMRENARQGYWNGAKRPMATALKKIRTRKAILRAPLKSTKPKRKSSERYSAYSRKITSARRKSPNV